ncbi:uncharacterized protein VTP21DRAFT_11238 [Calcarisporiella thermophila]|uniref:uncharacterized protein n=1 Tax=Calcarisporiella thermophila TaxID=911321 RepID=UPI00374409EA
MTPYQSIIHSFYWCVVTVTTTGYGDHVPFTPVGRLIASITMFCGVMMFALPTSIIGSNFIQEWQAYTQQIQKPPRLGIDQLTDLEDMRKRNGWQSGDTLVQDIDPSLDEKSTASLLREKNRALLKSIESVQEFLAEISPPLFYQKYKDLQLRLDVALQRMAEQDAELVRLRSYVEQLGFPIEPVGIQRLSYNFAAPSSSGALPTNQIFVPRQTLQSNIRFQQEDVPIELKNYPFLETKQESRQYP